MELVFDATIHISSKKNQENNAHSEWSTSAVDGNPSVVLLRLPRNLAALPGSPPQPGEDLDPKSQAGHPCRSAPADSSELEVIHKFRGCKESRTPLGQAGTQGTQPGCGCDRLPYSKPGRLDAWKEYCRASPVTLIVEIKYTIYKEIYL